MIFISKIFSNLRIENYFEFFFPENIVFLMFYGSLFFSILIVFLYLFNYNINTSYIIGLWSSTFIIFLSIILLVQSVNFENTLIVSTLFSFYPTHSLTFRFGVDVISALFILLTTICTYFSLLHADQSNKKSWTALISLFFLQWSIISAFMSFDLLSFFIFFETTLIPIFLIILLLGSRERRIRASYMISIYTLFGSIFMLFNIFYLISKMSTSNYYQLMNLDLTSDDLKFWWILFFIAFAAKIPMFPLHVWLPEAHVEAPTIGSVLLAVLLLKLGTYGIVRFLIGPAGGATIYYSSLINIFAIISVLYTSLTAIRQIDVKKIIAYSSVGHMNVVLLGLLVLNVENIEGSILQMLSHGIVSGALFLIVGAFYIRYKVRSIEYLGGFMVTYPLLSVMFLIFSLANISFPGTSNFVGEFMIMFGLFSQNTVMAVLASINMVTGAAYTLWSFNRISFGNVRDTYIIYHFDLIRREFYVFSFLVVLLLILGLQPTPLLSSLHNEVIFLTSYQITGGFGSF